MHTLRTVLASSAVLLFLAACSSTDEAPPAGPLQTETDERLRYELLDPHDHEFEITYELAVTRPGAKTYCTPVRGDTFVSEVTAEDVFTGKRLDVALVPGERAWKNGHPAADPRGSYLLIALDRPVPEHGEVRLRVHTKYEDRTSYRFHGDELEFARLLAAPAVSVVLPPDHALIECNVPMRVRRLEDGRLELAYEKRGPAPLPLRILARHVQTVPGAGSSAAGALLARPFIFQGERLSEDVEVEIVDADAGRITWRSELEVPARDGAPPAEAHIVVLPHARDVRVHARDTGLRLELVPCPEGQGGPAGANGHTALTWSAPSEAERCRVTIEAEVDDGAAFAAVKAAALLPNSSANFGKLNIDGPPLRSLRFPAGWSIAGSNAPIALHRLADGRSRVELGWSRVAEPILTLELWAPLPRKAETEPTPPVEPAPTPPKRKIELD